MLSDESSNTCPDPWLSTVVGNNASPLEFEDKFLPKKTIVPLDDSQNYIATLEQKLAKLKSGKRNPKREFLKAVEDTCSSYMFRVISSESRETLNVNQDSELETPVSPKLLNSWINPEQAVTIGELAELLKNDSLASVTQLPETSK